MLKTLKTYKDVRNTISVVAVLFAATVLGANAQSRDVVAQIDVTHVETLRLSDFDPTNPGAAPVIFTVTIANDDVQRNLFVLVRISGSRSGELGSTSMTLGPLVPLQTVVVTNRDFDTYDLDGAADPLLDYAYERGSLPADDYRFDLLIFDRDGGADDLLDEDSNFITTTNEGRQIELIGPGGPLDQFPEPISIPSPVFQWQGNASTYGLSLFEVLSGQGSPEDIENNLPVFSESGLTQLTYAYPGYAEELRSGVTYAWRVSSAIQTASGEQEVPGEMFWFTFDSGINENAESTVHTPVVRIEIDPQESTIAPGKTVRLSASAWDTNSDQISFPDLEWSVVPASAGSVDEDGFFTANAIPGVAAIVAESNGVSDFATITISNNAADTTSSTDGVRVIVHSPSDSQEVVEPHPHFAWDIVGTDSLSAHSFKVSLGRRTPTGTDPLWSRNVGQAVALTYPTDEAALDSGQRYEVVVSAVDTAGSIVAQSPAVHFALNRDPKLSWELYNAWDEALRTDQDSSTVTLLVMLAPGQSVTRVAAQIAELNGTVDVAESPWIQLTIPFQRLADLANLEALRLLTLPSPHVLFGYDVGKANTLHVAPLLTPDPADSPEPVDVAIFEFGFDRSAVESLLPADRITYHTFRQDNNVAGTNSSDATHGTASLKAMLEYLPAEARVHLINFDTEPEFQQALRYAVDDLGVRIITCSVSWANAYDHYDGTSFFSTNVADILSDKAALVVAAGNFAQSHWEDSFRDLDGDAVHDFENGQTDLILELSSSQRYDFLLSWDEWSRPVQDLDLEIVGENGEPLYDRFGRSFASRNLQSDAQFAKPIERIRSFTPIYPGTRKYRVRVSSKDVDTDVAAPRFELYVYPPPVNGTPDANPASSLASGLATTRSDAVIPVGAVGFSHSSQGPTNDGRIRPDFSASGVLQMNHRQFEGTSFATPRIAAVLARIFAKHPDWTIEQATNFLRAFTSVNLDSKDNVVGWGSIDLEGVISAL